MTNQVMMNQIIQVNDKNHGKQHDHEINEDLCQKLPYHWPVMVVVGGGFQART